MAREQKQQPTPKKNSSTSATIACKNASCLGGRSSLSSSSSSSSSLEAMSLVNCALANEPLPNGTLPDGTLPNGTLSDGTLSNGENVVNGVNGRWSKGDRTMNDRIARLSKDKRFQTKFALISTACSAALLLLLAAMFSERVSHEPSRYLIRSSHRQLDQMDDQVNDQMDDQMNDQIDYSEYRCDGIFDMTPEEDDSSPSQRCLYARTCESTGILLPAVFCHTSYVSTTHWLAMLSPLLLLSLALLFRLLGSTAEEYFSPSLEMFSLKLGLPPRFAGVTLLALGNGAADVSATMNAISSDPENGYKMSLGALTGAAMFITTCVAGGVIVANKGVKCRGALVRDVFALGVTVCVVAWQLGKGVVHTGTERTFISIYVLFVLIVLIADIYHRAVMLPRLQKQVEMREHQRQIEAERWASIRASQVLNNAARSDSALGTPNPSQPLHLPNLAPPTETNFQTSPMDQTNAPDAPSGLLPNLPADTQSLPDLQRSASAPLEFPSPKEEKRRRPLGNRALNAVLLALSNYNDNEGMDDMDLEGSQLSRNGWGVDSTIHGNQSWDNPVVLHGPDGLLARHPHHPHVQEEEEYQLPYRVMEDLDLVDRICVHDRSVGFPSINWSGAFQDGKQELIVHFREYLTDILEDEESGYLEKFLLFCEFPLTVMRKLTISIPCEGSYCRALVALSMALSPLWLGMYLLVNLEINLWGWEMLVMTAISFTLGGLVLRYAPGGDGTMATVVAVPIALYGFIIAATWIDAIADKLVSLLQFLGIMLRIPYSVMGLTVLAWGNSMADFSANITMARKGLANMAITACFAGPVFNILVGLGVGFSALRGLTGEEAKEVSLTPAIKTGFVFSFANCCLILVSGIVINKGIIPAGYGYIAACLYALYIATSLALQFTL